MSIIRTFFKNSEFKVLVVILFVSFKSWIAIVCAYHLWDNEAFSQKMKSFY
jgi:hypothetical protein